MTRRVDLPEAGVYVRGFAQEGKPVTTYDRIGPTPGRKYPVISFITDAGDVFDVELVVMGELKVRLNEGRLTVKPEISNEVRVGREW